MDKVLISIPENLISELDQITKNRSEFIRQAIKEKLKRERENLLIEGYSKEKNSEEWENTVSDGID